MRNIDTGQENAAGAPVLPVEKVEIMLEQQQAMIHELRHIRSQLRQLRDQSQRTAADVATAIDTARRALRERCPRVYAQWRQPAADRPET